jgi:hypothetical protein
VRFVGVVAARIKPSVLVACQCAIGTYPQYVGVWGPLLLLFTSQYVVLLVVPVPAVETAVELTVMGHTAHTGPVAAGAARASEAERRTRKAGSIVRIGVVVVRAGSARLLCLSHSASTFLACSRTELGCWNVVCGVPNTTRCTGSYA